MPLGWVPHSAGQAVGQELLERAEGLVEVGEVERASLRGLAVSGQGGRS